jgi:hypothetical protein
VLIDIMNVVLAVATIAFGLFGWLRLPPTMDYLGLASSDPSHHGKSEVRAASGALWVGASIGALVIFTPTAFLMLGFVYLGAAVGRITSIIIDHARTTRTWVFFGFEAVFAALLILFNLNGFSF